MLAIVVAGYIIYKKTHSTIAVIPKMGDEPETFMENNIMLQLGTTYDIASGELAIPPTWDASRYEVEIGTGNNAQWDGRYIV